MVHCHISQTGRIRTRQIVLDGKMNEDEHLFKVKRRKVSHRSVVDLDEVNGVEVESSAVIRGRVSSLGIKGLKVERPLMVIDDEDLSYQPRNELSHGLLSRFVGSEKTHPKSM